MKFPLVKVLKVYFALLGIVIVLGFLALVLMIPHKNRLQKQILALPHVQEKLADGFRVVEGCGSYKRKWDYEFSSVCLEKKIPDSAGTSATMVHEVVVHETGAAVSGCEYRVISPTDTTCLH